MSVLLIDDNKDFLEIFGSKLEVEGFEVIRASSGAEGIAKVRESHPDLILLDLEMPEENGIEVFPKIQQELGNRKFKIVFLTSYGEPQQAHSVIDKKFAEEIGAYDYIKKSDDLDKIVDQVKSIIRA